jgi:hypothetical protein
MTGGFVVWKAWWRWAANSSSCPSGTVAGFRRRTRRTISRARVCGSAFFEVNAVYEI